MSGYANLYIENGGGQMLIKFCIFLFEDWLPTTCWNSILALSNVPNFFEVEKSFEQFSTEWYTWYTAPEPENLELIGNITSI